MSDACIRVATKRNVTTARTIVVRNKARHSFYDCRHVHAARESGSHMALLCH